MLRKCLAMIIGLGLLSAGLWADEAEYLVKVVPESEQSYQGMLIVKGAAAYPYPIKGDRINQMMAKRLAVHDGMLKMAKGAPLLQAHLDQVYQPYIDNDFVRGVYVGSMALLDDHVEVELQYLFVCREDQYEDMKKALKRKVDFEEVKSFVQDTQQLDQGYEVTHSYWDKLVTFARRMSDE